MKKKLLTLLLIFIPFFLNAEVFNSKLTDEEKEKLSAGELIVKNINYKRNICLNENLSKFSDNLLKEIDDLTPKYLAEVIQYKPYEGNEDLPERLEEMLNNVPDYAGIPYYSVRAEEWYNLYDSASITEIIEKEDSKIIKADLEMSPFGTVNEEIEIKKNESEVLYIATNKNTLRYYDDFNCVSKNKMKLCIYLFRDGDNWVLYGIGGVNAPRIPFFTERIQTSFINRINTFCTFVFNKF